MVFETNKYAEQFIESHQVRRNSRMKISNTTHAEMKKFIGVIITTGVIKYPNTEDYWRMEPLFYHPLFHNIGMSCNSF